jgi:hypothetical protein
MFESKSAPIVPKGKSKNNPPSTSADKKLQQVQSQQRWPSTDVNGGRPTNSSSIPSKSVLQCRLDEEEPAPKEKVLSDETVIELLQMPYEDLFNYFMDNVYVEKDNLIGTPVLTIFATWERDLNKRAKEIKEANTIDVESLDEEMLRNYFRDNVYQYEGLLETPFETQYIGWRQENIGRTDAEEFWHYMDQSAMVIVTGEYSGQDETELSVGVDIAAAIVGADAPGDVVDLVYNLDHWETTPGHIFDTTLSAASLLPLIGAFKKARKLNELPSIAVQAKNAKELSAALEALDGIELSNKYGTMFKIRKVGDAFEITNVATGEVLKNSTNFAEILSAASKAEDVAKIENSTDAVGNLVHGANKAEDAAVIKNALSALSESELNALTKYTGDDYKVINDYLRGLADAPAEIKDTIKKIQEGLDKAYLPENMTIYRGTSPTELGDLQGLLPKDLVGQTFTQPSFLSTTIDKTIAEDFSKGLIMIIHAPEGAKALDISSISSFRTEAEILFQSGTEMLITDAKTVDGILQLTIEIIN